MTADDQRECKPITTTNNLAGQKGKLVAPRANQGARCNPWNSKALSSTSRPRRNAHQEPKKQTVVS